MTASTDALAAGTDPSRLTNHLRALLAVVLIADVLDLMDSTITNIAAPSIVRDIGGANPSLNGWAPAMPLPWACCWWLAAGSATATESASSS